MHFLAYLPFAVLSGTAATCAAVSALIEWRCRHQRRATPQRPARRPFRPVLVHARFSAEPARRAYRPVALRVVR